MLNITIIIHSILSNFELIFISIIVIIFIIIVIIAIIITLTTIIN